MNRVKFPNPEFGAFSTPLSVVDIKGRIVLWYLPGLIPSDRQVNVFIPPDGEIVLLIFYSALSLAQQL
jgi:hypothetical protein